jgi:hypothetical protein
MDPSSIQRSWTNLAPSFGSIQVYAQCVVAGLPSSSPAAPSTSAPVQTEVTIAPWAAAERR